MEELDVFNTEAMTDLIDFKWESYGMRSHLVGCMVHLAQLGILVFYIDFIYINNYLCETNADNELVCKDNPYAIILLGGILYPFVYECVQLWRQGFWPYFTSVKNWGDVLYIFGSIGMSVAHVVIDPFHLTSKVIMISVIMLSIIRTFKFMRIFKDYSPIVTMLQQVIIDLQQFMLFYTILLLLFSVLWGAMGLGNRTSEAVNPAFYAQFND